MRNHSCTDLPSYYTPSPGAWLKNDRPYPLEVYDIISLHFHDTLELGVCSEGQGVCRVEDREYPFCEGDVQVIFPFQNHLSRSEGGRQSKWYWVNLDPLDVLGTWGAPELGLLEQMLREKMGLCGILDRKKYPFLCELVRHVVLPGEETRRLVSLYALIVELAKVSSDLPKLSLSPARHFSRLLPTIEQMQSRLEEDLSTGVPAMAEVCGLSCAQFRRDFLAAMGCSPQQYTLNCRMQKAQRLLLLTDRKITDIALAVGYQDASGFNRCFREHFGVSPRQLRQRGKE